MKRKNRKMMTRKKVVQMKVKGILLSMAVVTAISPITVHAASYTDIAGHRDEAYITEYSAYGLVSGYPDGSFLPDANITRAEVTALINKLELPLVNQNARSFSDVPSYEWYYDIIHNAVKSGLVSGYEDNTFQPQKNISRFEAISIVSRMVESEEVSSIQLPYSDKDNIPTWVGDSVKNLYAAGIISTYEGNAISGNTSITRAEMVRMLDKMMRSYDFDTDEIVVTKKETPTAPTKIGASAAITSSFPHDILGYLTIESIGIKKYPVKDGADLETIQTAIGHFAETPLWDGNVAFCAHNRDYKYDFRNLKKVEKGDKIVYETRFGTRTYVVNEIEAISETDWDDVLEVNDMNQVTMITCIEDQPTKRLMVQAVQK